MSTAVVVALIQIIPSALWVLLGISTLVLFYRPVRYDLLPRMSTFNILGIEAEFVRGQMDRAITKRSVQVSDSDRARAVRRLGRLRDVFRDARILWLDGDPDRQADERAMLRFTGAIVDPARSDGEALQMLADTKYDAIVSAERSVGGASGPDLLTGMQARAIQRPVILYECGGRPARATPAEAFAVADRPDELLHCVADALERARI